MTKIIQSSLFDYFTTYCLKKTKFASIQHTGSNMNELYSGNKYLTIF